jgi:hypothetical protein
MRETPVLNVKFIVVVTSLNLSEYGKTHVNTKPLFDWNEACLVVALVYLLKV